MRRDRTKQHRNGCEYPVSQTAPPVQINGVRDGPSHDGGRAWLLSVSIVKQGGTVGGNYETGNYSLFENDSIAARDTRQE
jgi:hypothetical protein